MPGDNLLELQDHAGAFLRWITPEEGCALVEDRKIGEWRGTKRKMRAVQLVRATAAPDPALIGDLARPPQGKRYSHNRETRENPRGVWTLIRIPAAQRAVFQVSV